METEKHTPTPWWKGSWSGQCHKKHEHGNSDCKYDYTQNTESPCISSMKEGVELIGYDDYGPILSQANAEFIVRAVNEYDSLLAENRSLKLRYQELEERVGHLGAERMRLLEENEKLKALCDEMAVAGNRLMNICDELSYGQGQTERDKSIRNFKIYLEKYDSHLEGEKQKKV